MKHVLYALFVAVAALTMIACKAENAQPKVENKKDCDGDKCCPKDKDKAKAECACEVCEGGCKCCAACSGKK